MGAVILSDWFGKLVVALTRQPQCIDRLLKHAAHGLSGNPPVPSKRRVCKALVSQTLKSKAEPAISSTAASDPLLKPGAST